MFCLFIFIFTFITFENGGDVRANQLNVESSYDKRSEMPRDNIIC